MGLLQAARPPDLWQKRRYASANESRASGSARRGSCIFAFGPMVSPGSTSGLTLSVAHLTCDCGAHPLLGGRFLGARLSGGASVGLSRAYCADMPSEIAGF